MTIARTALGVARTRETESIIKSVRDKVNQISHISEIWHLNDFLSARRFDMDGKYDDREQEILFVLAKLMKQGWLSVDDLEGIATAKLVKLKALVRVL